MERHSEKPRGEKIRKEKPRNEKPYNEKSHSEQSCNEKPRGEKLRKEKPCSEKPRSEKPHREKPCSEKSCSEKSRNEKSLEGGSSTGSSTSEETYLEQAIHPHGWRLIVTTLGLFISLYLVNLEVTIVSTSLVTITDDLGGFDKTSWLVTAYLTTFTGFIPFWTRISDLIGRKRTLIATIFAFLIFSLACGLSDNITQLIIFRAFQGFGGAGVYPLSILCTYEVGAKEKLPLFGGIMSFAVACASLTGPIIGGVLAEHSEWRWVFYVNLPPAALSILMIALAMPTDFGTTPRGSLRLLKPSMFLVRRIDAIGVFLLLAASFLLVTVLNETFVEFKWSSHTAIALLATSGALWAIFFIWEWFIIPRWAGYYPVFPKRFLYNRAWLSMLITTFVSACPWNVVVVYLSQRFIILSQLSPLQAGIHLIPYSAVSTLATTIANLACLKGRIPFIYIVMFGSVLHTVGMALVSTVPNSGALPARLYGYEAIAGAGVGVTIGNVILAVPYVVDTVDLSTATGALNQCRFLGGAIGLSIASNILNGRLKNQLSDVLPSGQLSTLLHSASSISQLPKETQAETLSVFAGSYRLQMQIMIGFAALQIPATLLMLKRGRQYVVSAETQ